MNERELYLVGVHGELHDGSIHGTARRAGSEDLGMLERVTKRDGKLWVGSGDTGQRPKWIEADQEVEIDDRVAALEVAK